MSKRKGLSVEEKRSRMMDFFFEKKDFFLLKELEKQCQKEKGITSMSVKDIVQSLVDDGMVDTDKIGTSIYFWAFPSKASQNRKRKINELEEELKEVEKKYAETQEKCQKMKIGKEDTDERHQILKELQSKTEEHEHLLKDIERFKECDPEMLEAMKQEVDVAKEAANRWTDNVFSTKSWVKNKFCVEDSVIDKQFGIPEDLDYVE
ncbi:unnamed protein product [Owenia fusiformis]|uniref:Meiotic nuclear division protein 1 homolog n=1 Tax=Owenia fusiformis TaxID=6347 RepID=A0A8S4Q5N6_OWEFU|nr:unnamed protein product [Owenia fusiformis]